ncbi:MAG: virulence-associated E family protein [Bacteroidota bacterium]|nr:MAG: virulence-associated E family protein [Bacteroidota bacterium]
MTPKENLISDTPVISLKAQKNTGIDIMSKTEIVIESCYEIRYNKVSLDFESRIINSDDNYSTLNIDDLFVFLIKNGVNITKDKLISLLKSSFIKNYDPIDEYFDKLPNWDGRDYISELADYFELENENEKPIFKKHLKKHFVRVIACAKDSKFVNKQAFIIISFEQNTGKTYFCRWTCPPKLSDYIAEDISTDKDSRILLTKNLLINIDELAVMSKKDIDSLKALFSKQQINERLPYDRKNSILPRRCSFIGSTNKTDFLTDESGSVRWVCFEIKKINKDYSKKISIDSLYSQSMALYKTYKSNPEEFDCQLSPEEIIENERRNKKYQAITMERELIEMHFKPDEKRHPANFKTATEIIMRINTLTEGEFKNKLNNVQIGKALSMLKYPKGKDKNDRYGYFIIDQLVLT